eukprot:scaffold63905_cov46-Attheya_sp.AAC.2
MKSQSQTLHLLLVGQIIPGHEHHNHKQINKADLPWVKESECVNKTSIQLLSKGCAFFWGCTSTLGQMLHALVPNLHFSVGYV